MGRKGRSCISVPCSQPNPLLGEASLSHLPALGILGVTQEWSTGCLQDNPTLQCLYPDHGVTAKWQNKGLRLCDK